MLRVRRTAVLSDARVYGRVASGCLPLVDCVMNFTYTYTHTHIHILSIPSLTPSFPFSLPPSLPPSL